MTWIYVNNFTSPGDRQVSSDAIRSRASVGPASAEANSQLLTRGTILFDLDMAIEGRVPKRLVHFESDQGWERRFSVYLNADHSLSIEAQQGPARSYVRLADCLKFPAENIRVTYAWDAPARIGLMTVECLKSGAIKQAVFDGPIPLPRLDVEMIAAGGSDSSRDARLRSISVSDSMEPVGPSPSISIGTMVETTDGPRAIERLQLGDEVITVDNGPQPIRWIVKQELPAAGLFNPIILRAPYLGLTHDIVVAPRQRVMISGADAEYLFGEDAVLVQARQLLGHPAATMVTDQDTQTYYQLVLDKHDCISLCGAWSESLYLGNLASCPELLATTRLAQLARSAVPVHRKLVRPMLRSFETTTLLDALSA